MSMPHGQITQLEQSIVELERQRTVLGEQVADTAIAALRDKLNTLRAPESKGAALAPPDAVLGSEQLLTRFMPNELADKFRASPKGEGSSESGDLSGYAAEALAQQLMDAMRRYLSALSQRQPTVLVFEDLHWADDASLNLLLYVSSLVRQEPLLLIALLRPDKDAPSWPIIERVQADLADLFSKITLAPLSLDQTQELLAQMLPGLDLPESVRALVWHKAEGNPFFVEEVLRSLIDAQSIVRDGEQWRLSGEPTPLSIPNTLTALLAARIDRLPADAKQVAQVAAVIGRTFTYPLLEAVCTAESLGGGQASLRAVLEQLSLVDLLHVSGHEPEMQYQFKHALTQEAAYNSLLIKRRKALHRRPCAALEQLSAQVRVALEMRDGMRRGFGAE